MMQMPPKPLRCVGKTAHLSHQDAAKELKVSNGPRMTIYKCVHCLAWHIGHNFRRNNKRWNQE